MDHSTINTQHNSAARDLLMDFDGVDNTIGTNDKTLLEPAEGSHGAATTATCFRHGAPPSCRNGEGRSAEVARCSAPPRHCYVARHEEEQVKAPPSPPGSPLLPPSTKIRKTGEGDRCRCPAPSKSSAQRPWATLAADNRARRLPSP
nr:hypothetical protein Iba_chr04fCG10980 [Ipomoea batatas]